MLEPESQPLIPEAEVLAHLKKRQGILEGICITGGEPTLEGGLREFILQCRAVKSSVPEGDAVRRSMSPFSKQEMEQMAVIARKYMDKVLLRGVE